jgi:putative hydrolase of the HAD superfamily
MPRQLVLALDVDGVILDPTRGGQGTWHTVVEAELGITAEQLKVAFFTPYWSEIVIGRRAIEPALRDALEALGSEATVEDVLSCWFQTDFWPNKSLVAKALEWSQRGARLAVVTNQEHRRAAYLRERLPGVLPIDLMAYSAEFGCLKDDPHFYELASTRIGTDDVVYLDDDLRNVQVAEAAGWTALHYRDDVDFERALDAAFTATFGESG